MNPWISKPTVDSGDHIREFLLSEAEHEHKQFIDDLCDRFMKEWMQCVADFNEKEKEGKDIAASKEVMERKRERDMIK